jgi:hypothetical protein
MSLGFEWSARSAPESVSPAPGATFLANAIPEGSIQSAKEDLVSPLLLEISARLDITPLPPADDTDK